MSEIYEKARAIAEAAANGWDKFGDTQGIARLADMIMEFGALPRDDGRCMCAACRDARGRVEAEDELAGILHKAFSHPDAVDHSSEVVGLPMLIRTKGGWYALGEDGMRLNLVCASRDPKGVS